MFKRVERRIRKKEEEEELGLDEETKEMLGLNAADTDSEESDSSSDSEGDSEGEQGFVQDEEASDAGEDVMEDGGEDEEESGAGSDEEGEDDEDEAPMSVSEALQNPLWHVSLEPEVKACAACPGKLLKNPTMIDVHMKSGAHKRRFAKLREAAMNVDPEADVRDLVRAQRLASQPEKSTEDRLSKRAEKKKAKLAAIKARRAKQKVMKAKHRAKKEAKEKFVVENEAVAPESGNEADSKPVKPPAAKKRKVGRVMEEEDGASEATTSPAKKQRLPKPTLTSPKASKPLRESKTGSPPKILEETTANSKQKLTAEPILSSASDSKKAKATKKRKHRDVAS